MSRARNDILISVFLVFLLAWVVWEARAWPFRTRFFPWAIGFPVLVLALVQFGTALRKGLRQQSNLVTDTPGGERKGKVANGNNSPQPPPETFAVEHAGVIDDPTVARARTIAISAWTVTFAVGFWLFGFKCGAPLLSLAFLRFHAKESWKTTILFVLGIYLSFLAGFEIALGVPLPAGVIATSIGLQSFDRHLLNFLLDLIVRR